ncbi:metallophosphoesterase [Echinicola marina]|uniref:metallophosphoesterase n=1 Tax=Echinicola marina TaxID=2859768 RepID=UPI001CF64F88|nr:BamA/TamA family outer membrane protein [Echinicola marina]UCS92479.1 metallophosphoesterase [Echinicola marina]
MKHIALLMFFSLTGILQAQTLERRIILIGDAGELDDGKHPVVELVSEFIDEDTLSQKTDILFLGDNIYPKGMPEIGDPNRPESEYILTLQANMADKVNGEVIFLPGNHDWEKGHEGGYAAVLRAQAFIDSLNREKLFWKPRDACPGPELREIGDKAIMIIVDSQWWLHPNEKPGLDSDCDYKTAEEVLAAMADMVNANKDKTIILAMHHPLKTYGEHNGAYNWKDHLFPFTAINPNLYIPLPVIGSIYPLYRTYLGNIQDIPHPKYQEMIEGINKIISSHSKVIVVGGHEHALEYTLDQHIHHIVSGSGSKSTKLRKNKPCLFAMDQRGFASLDLYSNGSVNLNFFSLEIGLNPVYQSEIIKGKPLLLDSLNINSNTFPDTVKVSISEQYHANRQQEKWYGTNYRKIWSEEVAFRVFDISKERGGMKIVKRGGGMQTKSLRLEDSSGKQYVLRSVEKYPAAAIPEVLRKTVAIDIVQDQISASNPYGAIMIPPLADALKVYHTHPELVWLPDDPALGIYQQEFGNAVYLYEERETSPEGLSDEDYKFYSTEKMLKKRLEDQDYVLDQKNVLRARLLDLFIGDWDRHDDQWRWIGIEHKEGREFLPMPRDRDQAFFVNQGILPKIASRKWIMPKFQGFDDHLRDINGFMFNGRYFDRSFLNDLDREDWEDELDRFQEKMDSNTIEGAIATLPKTIQDILREEHHINSTLNFRKSWIKEEALKYYGFLAENVDVYGTNKDELFEIRHEPDGKVDVEITKITKKGKLEQKFFSRKFDPEETKEVRIYGLNGDDKFNIIGKGPGKIKIRLMSGLSADTIIDDSQLKKKSNIIYQWKDQKDNLHLGTSNKIKESKSSTVFNYNRKAFKYDILMPLASFEYNVDDGIFLGAGALWTTHGFRKDPYAVKQSIKANMAVKTGAFNIYYEGHAIKLINQLDLEWNASLRAPDYVNNFFGYGNESSEFLKDEFGPQYYRIRYNQINLNTWIRHNLNQNIFFRIGPQYQRVKMDEDDNIGKYINSENQTDIDIEELNQLKQYAGLNAQFIIDQTDHPKLPNRGIKFLHEFNFNAGLNESSNTLSSMNTEIALFWSRLIPSQVTWATRFGSGFNWGQYEFFQSQNLGGQDNLRGYRRSRFQGQAMVYNNTEARIRLNNFTTRLFPASVGLTLFHDIGRVWYEDENSSKWHNSFGAGLWLAPMNMMVVSGTLSIGQEEILPSFTFGYQF